MTAQSSARESRSARMSIPRLPGTWLVFTVTLGLMLFVWLLLAVVYSGIGGGTSLVESRGIISAVTSSKATSGDLEVRAVLATPEYFSATSRSDEIFNLAPEENLATLSTSPDAFDVYEQSAEDLTLNPERMLAVLLTIDVHEGELPPVEDWASGVELSVDGRPMPAPDSYSVAFQSQHHQTLALQFPLTDDQGSLVLNSGSGRLVLAVPNIESGTGNLSVAWPLPIDYPEADSGGLLTGGAATLGGVIAIMAGLLVVFSPCVVHMTAYFLPVITGLGMQEIVDRKGDVQFRAHVALSGVAFVSGFVVLYTAFGVAAGFAGTFFSNTAQMEPYLLPFRIVTGLVVIYLAFQTLGVFKTRFVTSLQLPGKPHSAQSARRGYLAAAIAGMSISLGCLVCVGGTLLASLLIYAGASSSPLVGGLTLFLFSLGMSIPFLLAAFAFDKVLPKFEQARSLIRYSTPVAGAVMLVVGLLILSGNDSVFEQLVV